MSIVFSDKFRPDATTDIASYPSGTPNYAYVTTADGITVDLAKAQAMITAVASHRAARILTTYYPIPTGDQEVSATVYCTTAGESSYVIARASAGGNYYYGYLDMTVTNEVALLRCDSGVPTTLLTVDHGFSAGYNKMRLKVTGTDPVLLELQLGYMSPLFFSDSHANRKTSGTPGLGGYSITGETVWVDTLSVDDLVIPAPPPRVYGLSGF